MVFIVLMLIPLLVAIAGFVFLKTITWKEFGLQVGAQLIVAVVSALVISCESTSDHEVWNGRVTNKVRERVSCEHSYTCNCQQICTGSGTSQSCTTVCQTCYDHSYDVSWRVHTSNGEVITINRVDRQGLNEPPRWTSTQIGEPTSVAHEYTNYVKAAPDTLFRHQGLKKKYSGQIPAYPGHIYDYYRLSRLVTVGVGVQNSTAWNEMLSDVNADLGAARQANVIVLLTDRPPDFYYAVEEAWIGSKKNDIVVVVGVKPDGAPAWATIMAWESQEIFKVKLRDNIMALPKVDDPAAFQRIIRNDVLTYHKRKPMKDFEYLKSSIVPTGTQWVVSLVVGLLVAVGLTWLFHEHDVFGDERDHSYGYGRARLGIGRGYYRRR